MDNILCFLMEFFRKCKGFTAGARMRHGNFRDRFGCDFFVWIDQSATPRSADPV